MGYPVVRISTDTPTRQPTPSLWRNELEVYDGPASHSVVQSFYDEFLHPSTQAEAEVDAVNGGWLLNEGGLAGGTVTAPTDGTPEGVKVLTVATGTPHLGGSLLRAGSGTAVANIPLPSHATFARGRVVFEAYIDSDSANVEFIGLSDSGADLLSDTSALPDANYIGFFKGESGDLTFVTSDTAVGTQVNQSLIVVPAADIPTGFFKVGFSVNRDLSVEIVVNEVSYKQLADTVNPAALPTASLLPRIEATAGAVANAVALPIDWVKLVVAV